MVFLCNVFYVFFKNNLKQSTPRNNTIKYDEKKGAYRKDMPLNFSKNKITCTDS